MMVPMPRPQGGHRLASLILISCSVGMVIPGPMSAQEPVFFPTSDGGRIHGSLYGEGTRGVVLTHGGRFNKESWAEQARIIATAGFRVLAIDFRGYGNSTGPGEANPMGAPLHLDVLAAAHYLRQVGSETVSVVGGSMGGTAAANASIAAGPGVFDAVVMLAGTTYDDATRLTGRKLFIMAAGDTTGSGALRLPGFRQQYDRAPEPKRLMVLEGAAHAQYLFQTDQGTRLLQEIIRFLSTERGGTALH